MLEHEFLDNLGFSTSLMFSQVGLGGCEDFSSGLPEFLGKVEKVFLFLNPLFKHFTHSCVLFHLGMESDDEIRRVPEIGGEVAGASASGRDGGSVAGPVQPSAAGSRKRVRSPADKENKRLKR